MKTVKRISAVFFAVAIMIVTLAVSAETVNAAGFHAVTFLYGAKAYTTVVADGGYAVPPTDTYVPGYTFLGWVGDYTNVKEDRTILGAYAPVCAVTTHTVKFIDGLTGETYFKQEVQHGFAACPPVPPCHPGFVFVGYEGTYNEVTCSRTIIAKYVPACGYYPYFCFGKPCMYPCVPQPAPLPECVQQVVDHNTEVINSITNQNVEDVLAQVLPEVFAQ